MSTVVLLVASFGVAIAWDAAAEIRFEPRAPVPNEPFRIVFSGVWRDSCVPANPRLDVHYQTLLVTLQSSGGDACAATLTPWSATIDGVRLGPADYVLVTRYAGERLEELFESMNFRVSGSPVPVVVSPAFDAETGGCSVSIFGPFPCNSPPCTPPEVLFGTKQSPEVRHPYNGFIDAVAPPGQGIVDVTVKSGTFSYTKVSAFQYVSRDDWEALLLPIHIPNVVEGAYGSRWIIDWSVLNENETPLEAGLDLLAIDVSCQVTCPAFPPLYPGAVESYLRLVSPNIGSPPPVALFHVRKEAAEHLTGSLRTRDLTRQSENWGCEIPIIRERELQSSVTLVDVPREERFRQRLRIYDPVYPAEPARVEFFDPSGPLLVAKEVELAWPVGSIGGLPPVGRFPGSPGFPLQPAVAEIDLGAVPELQGHERIRIRVTARYGQKIWAFVSITNNETQHVSTVTPQ
ncbi:MAG: hypothetical protein WC538_02315 [Thermoanaerobaculia bacterium]|jgi:hypothetical protein